MSTKKKVLTGVAALAAVAVVAAIAMVISANRSLQSDLDFHATLPDNIELRSDDFGPNGAIPQEFTADGAEISPSLTWDGVPPGTQSLAITVVDYDGPSPSFRLMSIDHWVLYDIDPAVGRIEQAASPESLMEQGVELGQNVYGEMDYVGPAPPLGVHEYYFRIYALSVPSLDLEGPTRSELMEGMKDHIIGYGELIGTYGG